jgi:hypothetical protein
MGRPTGSEAKRTKSIIGLLTIEQKPTSGKMTKKKLSGKI